MFQQPTRKDSNVQVRCLQPLIRTSYATGHDSLELTGALSIGAKAAPAAKAAPLACAGILDILSIGIRLPNLDHCVVHRRILAIEDTADQFNACALHSVRCNRANKTVTREDVEEWADGLGRRDSHHFFPSKGVASRPRSAMLKRYPRA